MKIIKGIGIALLSLIVLLLIIGLFLPKDFHIRRSISIMRPRTEVFAYVSHLKNQNDYSKWNMADPSMKREYRGTDGQPGFVSAWDGNDEVGKGEQEITAVRKDEQINTELRFERPFKSKASAYIHTYHEGPAQTKVEWGFDGRQPYPMNLMSLFMNMDKMIGDDLAISLANLKRNLESRPPITQ